MKKSFIILLLFLLTATGSYAQKFEAENATLTDGASKVADSEASGGYYVAQAEGTITFPTNLPADGYYSIHVQVSSPYGNRSGRMTIDGSAIDFSIPQNNHFVRMKVINTLRLTKGIRDIKIIKPWGWINIDYIEVENVNPPAPVNITTTLVTPDPMDETSRLYQFLYDNFGKKIISGVMTLTSMDEVNWLKNNTGKEPALVGLDFMHSNRGYTWYNENDPLNDAIYYYSRNGIPALFWHWRDPSRKTESFYTSTGNPNDCTSFDISKIFDETSDEYKAMIGDIDYTAGLLKKFQDNHVPVVWRPLHEAAGGWFWWGAKGPAAYKKLWQLMFDRMINYHGLHNLIWIYTHEPNDDEWYPGDEYADMVSRDIYREGDHGSQILEFNDLINRYKRNKMAVIGDCGSFPDADSLQKDGAAWSWFMPWYTFIRDNQHNSLDHWKKTLASDYVLTLDEMPNLKSYGINSTTEALKNVNDFQVYPTSFNDSFTVTSLQPLKTIAVYNQSGIKIKSVNPKNTPTVISLDGFPSGLYIVKADEKPAMKVVKK